MFSDDQYELIDFGEGRRLEQFGGFVVDRPCPVAEGMPRGDSSAWQNVHARFERGENDGVWKPSDALPDEWTIAHDAIKLQLKPTPFGHLGVFPEQAENWDWIAKQVARAGRPLRVLNLFAYTGGSTLAAAAAGAEVTHVDAAKNVVAWARRNAEASGLAEAPIRWIAEDARKFVKREAKRGSRYDAVILDPPSYGHGPRGEVWRLVKHLPQVLELCAELTQDARAFVLLTCHTPKVSAADLEAYLADGIFGHCGAGATAQPLTIRSRTGSELPSGLVARWPG